MLPLAVHIAFFRSWTLCCGRSQSGCMILGGAGVLACKSFGKLTEVGMCVTLRSIPPGQGRDGGDTPDLKPGYSLILRLVTPDPPPPGSKVPYPYLPFPGLKMTISRKSVPNLDPPPPGCLPACVSVCLSPTHRTRHPRAEREVAK